MASISCAPPRAQDTPLFVQPLAKGGRFDRRAHRIGQFLRDLRRQIGRSGQAEQPNNTDMVASG